MKGASTEKKGRSGLPASSLKGTFVSVLILAAFMLLSWSAVFVLFLSRN